MSGHTPGPWTVEPCSENAEIVNIVANARTLPDGRRQANWIAECDLQDGRIEENHANARLIAAAPDLLAACKLILDAEPFPPNVGAKFTRAQRAVEAAIAKAEGH